MGLLHRLARNNGDLAYRTEARAIIKHKRAKSLLLIRLEDIRTRIQYRRIMKAAEKDRR